MKFGLHSVNLHTCAYPDAGARLARAAEAAGFESLWVADHVVLPDPPVAGRPMAPDMRLLEPIVALAFLAAHTSKIKLATGVIILPQRQAVVIAKQLASLDVLSNGRVIFGLGVGWCEPEMASTWRRRKNPPRRSGRRRRKSRVPPGSDASRSASRRRATTCRIGRRSMPMPRRASID